LMDIQNDILALIHYALYEHIYSFPHFIIIAAELRGIYPQRLKIFHQNLWLFFPLSLKELIKV